MSDPQVEKEAGPTPPAAETPTQEPEKRKREYKDFGHDHDDKPTRKYQVFLMGSNRVF